MLDGTLVVESSSCRGCELEKYDCQSAPVGLQDFTPYIDLCTHVEPPTKTLGEPCVPALLCSPRPSAEGPQARARVIEDEPSKPLIVPTLYLALPGVSTMPQHEEDTNTADLLCHESLDVRIGARLGRLGAAHQRSVLQDSASVLQIFQADAAPYWDHAEDDISPCTFGSSPACSPSFSIETCCDLTPRREPSSSSSSDASEAVTELHEAQDKEHEASGSRSPQDAQKTQAHGPGLSSPHALSPWRSARSACMQTVARAASPPLTSSVPASQVCVVLRVVCVCVCVCMCVCVCVCVCSSNM